MERNIGISSLVLYKSETQFNLSNYMADSDCALNMTTLLQSDLWYIASLVLICKLVLIKHYSKHRTVEKMTEME